MDEYTKSNLQLWNEWTSIHEKSEYYDLEGFKAGKSSLRPLEIGELGDVAGKSLLHLQCHFGKDTLSWARLGAHVTGADFSDRAIALAQSLSRELGIPASFVRSDIYDLPNALSEQFDIVYTGGGALMWLPDMTRWAQVVAHFLKPGGTLYVLELHPFSLVFENTEDDKELKLTYDYFHSPEPLMFEAHGSYAAPDADYHFVEYNWVHSLADIVNALISAGLRIEFLHEFPFTMHRTQFFGMEQVQGGYWKMKDLKTDLPLMFSIKATKVTSDQ